VGDAKRRGTFEDRVKAAKTKRTPPTLGLYISTKTEVEIRIIVENVFLSDESSNEQDEFFLVDVVDEADANDTSAISDELDPDQWFALVDEYGLVRVDSAAGGEL
jgi:hypothetical protein